MSFDHRQAITRVNADDFSIKHWEKKSSLVKLE